jgi:putative nucleotidyltransferase with HDIG domain
MGYPTREQALALLHEHVGSPALRAHALAVEAAMRHYARHFGEDEDAWGVTGLLHDFDYERYPSIHEHPFRGAEILRNHGYDEEMVRAVLGHAPHTGVPRETRMAKTLFAVDEPCGLITAVAHVRPSRRLSEVTVKSVVKKMKVPGFARNISREDIVKGAAELGVDLEDHIGRCIEAMRSVAEAIGL